MELAIGQGGIARNFCRCQRIFLHFFLFFSLFALDVRGRRGYLLFKSHGEKKLALRLDLLINQFVVAIIYFSFYGWKSFLEIFRDSLDSLNIMKIEYPPRKP